MPGFRVQIILACILVSACAVAPDPAPEGTAPPPDLPRAGPSPEVTVLVAEFARKHGFIAGYDSERNRLELDGEKGEIVMYPGTSVVTVNGTRVKGIGKVRIYNGHWVLRPEDAVRVEKTLYHSRHRTRRTTRPSRPPPLAAVASPDPAWRVRLDRQWRYIVIHHSGTRTGSAKAFDQYHREVNGWDGLGYHFVIGNGTGSGDGQVEVGGRWVRQKTGAHAGRAVNGSNLMNETGVGICLVGDFESTEPTRRQMAAMRRLLGFLGSYCGIGADRVLLHRDIRDTACPGERFPESEFLEKRRTIPAGTR